MNTNFIIFMRKPWCGQKILCSPCPKFGGGPVSLTPLHLSSFPKSVINSSDNGQLKRVVLGGGTLIRMAMAIRRKVRAQNKRGNLRRLSKLLLSTTWPH